MNQTPDQDAEIVDTADQDLLICLKTVGPNVRMRIAGAKQIGPEQADDPSVVIAAWLVQNWQPVALMAMNARQAQKQAEAQPKLSLVK
jgi:hypothetical protein